MDQFTFCIFLLSSSSASSTLFLHVIWFIEQLPSFTHRYLNNNNQRSCQTIHNTTETWSTVLFTTTYNIYCGGHVIRHVSVCIFFKSSTFSLICQLLIYSAISHKNSQRDDCNDFYSTWKMSVKIVTEFFVKNIFGWNNILGWKISIEKVIQTILIIKYILKWTHFHFPRAIIIFPTNFQPFFFSLLPFWSVRSSVHSIQHFNWFNTYMYYSDSL